MGVECADPGRCVVNAVSGDLLRYAQQVLTGTGHAPDQVASVVARTGEDAAARALMPGRCHRTRCVLVAGTGGSTEVGGPGFRRGRRPALPAREVPLNVLIAGAEE